MMETHMSHPYISKRGATRAHRDPGLAALQLHLAQTVRLWAEIQAEKMAGDTTSCALTQKVSCGKFSE